MKGIIWGCVIGSGIWYLIYLLLTADWLWDLYTRFFMQEELWIIVSETKW